MGIGGFRQAGLGETQDIRQHSMRGGILSLRSRAGALGQEEVLGIVSVDADLDARLGRYNVYRFEMDSAHIIDLF